jgi:hypothetical protein|tara:strand:- start:2951 stop:3151 length:201 start_codon:yes stop_codon:yes gene_type:complete
MRNRELIIRRLENVDAILSNLKRIVNTKEPVKTYQENINKAQDILDDVKSMIEREPISPSELNTRS